MKGKFSKVLTSFALVVSMVGVVAPVSAATGDFSLTIMHTNDTHAQLNDVAKRATLVDKIRSENPNNLLVDAGDVFSGTLFFNEFKGQADLAMMNYMKYDAMTFGNHEFDLGSVEENHDTLAEFVKGAKFPFVSSNVDFSKAAPFKDLQHNEYTAEFENGNIYNGIIKSINGEKIGIFGLTTEETPAIATTNTVEFNNYIEKAKDAVDAFEQAGVNKIIVLSHLGYNDSEKYDNDQLLAKAVPEIDVIVGGHSHTKLEEPAVVGTTVIVQTGANGENLGELDVTFDANGVITDHAGTLHKVADAEEQAEVAELLAPYAKKVKEKMEEQTGLTSKVYLDGVRANVRTGETNLGNLIADSFLASAKAIDEDVVIGLANGGGIRASIDKGPITVGEVINVMPYSNSLGILELTGAEIKEALEHSVEAYPTASGAFLHVSGLKFTFDPNAEAGKRVLNVLVDEGKGFVALDSKKSYKVGVNTFTAKGGDDYKVFEKATEEGRLSEPGNVDYEMFLSYLRTLDEINPTIEQRITAVLPFKDVKLGDWAYPYISDLYYQGKVKGVSDTSFDPQRKMTRAQAASLIVRGLGLTTDQTAPFSDIKNYAEETQKEIAAAQANGIVKGIDGKFMPSQPVTRAQFALMLNRAYNLKKEAPYTAEEKAPFTDFGKYDQETVNAITMLHEFEIASGDNGKFMPTSSTTRKQSAKMISNFLNVLER